MKKIIHNLLKAVFCLIMLMPILGGLGMFPEPTADLYNSQEAYEFIKALYRAGYITPIMSIVFGLALVCVVMKRMAVAALLILPLTVNIVAFHLFLDGGLFTTGSIMANLLLILNMYFLWQNREVYRTLSTTRS